MSGFDAIIGQPVAVGMLQAFLSTDSVPHALLLTGIPGVGRSRAARTLAAACNCVQTAPPTGAGPSPCGTCRSCRKIDSDQHPDVITLRPSGATYRVDQIRRLIDQLALRPYEARRRVVILESAERLNPSAGNAILKLLEEPPEQTLLCLTATNTADVLPTIVSRCTVLRFRPLADEELIRVLTADGVSPAEAAAAAASAFGSPTQARDRVTGDWLNLRRGIIAPMVSADGIPAAHQQALAARWADSRENALAVLDILMTWCRDVAVHHWRPAMLTDPAYRETVEHAAAAGGPALAAARCRLVIRARRRLEANANPRLTLESLLIRWHRCDSPTGAGGGSLFAPGTSDDENSWNSI